MIYMTNIINIYIHIYGKNCYLKLVQNFKLILFKYLITVKAERHKQISINTRKSVYNQSSIHGFTFVEWTQRLFYAFTTSTTTTTTTTTYDDCLLFSIYCLLRFQSFACIGIQKTNVKISFKVCQFFLMIFYIKYVFLMRPAGLTSNVLLYATLRAYADCWSALISKGGLIMSVLRSGWLTFNFFVCSLSMCCFDYLFVGLLTFSPCLSDFPSVLFCQLRHVKIEN